MAAEVGVVSSYRFTRPCFSSLEVPRLFRICSCSGAAREEGIGIQTRRQAN